MKFVEATIVIPVTVIIIMSLIGLTMSFWTDMEDKVNEHEKIRNEICMQEYCW